MNLYDIAIARKLSGNGGGGGSSDFSTAEVTIVNNSETAVYINTQFVYEDSGDKYWEQDGYDLSAPATVTLDTILFQGVGYMTMFVSGSDMETFYDASKVSVTGDIEKVPDIDDAWWLEITGNGTITIS